MERHREARKGTMAAAATNGSGGGSSRKRQRNSSSSSFRDSPEEDGRMEISETSTRLRDRGTKKDRDRDRSSRSRRRRGERLLHGSNRDEGDESSEESMDQDDENEDEEDVSVPARLPPSSPPMPISAAASSPQENHQHQQLPRKSFLPKAVKWKADEMIGVPVPRKARSASTKRAHEPPVTGGGGAGAGAGGGEHITRQASGSPSRLSPAPTAQLSPSSSNGSLRKKMKPTNEAKHWPKFSKSASLCQDEIEIEIAEVLFGMTRQFDTLAKQDGHKMDSRDIDGGSGTEAKSRVSSPSSLSPSPAAYASALPSSISCFNSASLPTIAPKQKRPRPVKFGEESPTSPVVLHNISSLSAPAPKVGYENPEGLSPRSGSNSATPTVKTGGAPVDISVSQDGLFDGQQQESAKAEKSKIQDLLPSTGGSIKGDRVENREELVLSPRVDVDVSLCETTAKKIPPQRIKEEKFKFDLMVLPGKLSPEGNDFNVLDSDHKLQGLDIEMAPELSKDKAEEKPAVVAVMKVEHQIEKSAEKDTSLKKQAVIRQIPELQLDLEKPKKEDVGSKQKAKDPKAEPKPGKSGSASLLHMPLTVGPWPGAIPPYGYMGQVPPLQIAAPINGTADSSCSLQPPAFLQSHPRPNRCATHCFIAKMISNYQKFARMNCFWTAGAGATPFYAAKPYNHNVVLSLDSSLSGNQMQGGFLSTNAGTLQDTKGAPVVVSSYTRKNASQEKILQANNTISETAQRKQLILQQMPQSGSASNIPHGPAFIFPINQPQLLQPAAVAAGAGRAGSAKSTTSSGAEVRTSVAISSSVGSNGAGGSATPMNLNFANMPTNDAQYVAFLQNNGYPFPIPSQYTGAPFRGNNNAQPMPFFYPSHLLHSQLRLHQQQQAESSPHVQQSNQNPSTLSVSTQKHSQQSTNGFPATTQMQDLLPQQARPKECIKGVDANLHLADASVQMGNAGSHGNNQPIYQQAQQKQNMKMAAAVAAQATEHKKINHVSEDGKSLAMELRNTNINEADGKTVVASKGIQQSSLSVDVSSQPHKPIQPPASRLSDHSAGIMPASTSLTATTIAGNSHQQQHLIHLPKHQQQHLQMQHHLASSRSKPSNSGNNVGVHHDSLPAGSTISKNPHALTGFPQALIQGGNPIHWPQGKSSAGRGVDPGGAAPAPVVKNNFLQLQGRASQQSLPSQGHQTQISFGINGNKQGGQHLSGACGSPSSSSATVAVGSPSNSISKSAGGSPRASAHLKPSPQASAILLSQQTNVKQSTSSPSSKSNTSNPNMVSILGHHAQKLPAPSSTTKQQQPQQPKQQSSEAQLFFSNPNLQQVQCAQSNASAAQYYQKRPYEQSRQTQQQQQHNSGPSASGMLSLCATSALTLAGVPTASDPTKATMAVNSLAAAKNLKGLPPNSFLNAAQLAVAAQSASASPLSPISATFSYMSLPPFSVKPTAEQKPTAGKSTDNLHSCWQPEKR
ncbi:protein TIME FOR COFFEE-like isoform X3 [Zingiber officinale]|uniref:protein TIME FOR COFFEE-like isoform X3 n=1 Tax=Zingiber officinale TaxID=94328 RepID=UPI001C4ACFA9|nr:protein TIME FOR COFFEE-like isoform X3 [Zingiber officinale]